MDKPRLCVSRRPGEKVIITTPAGERIEVELHGVRGNKVGLGIVADKSITVHRGEVQAEIDGGEA